MDDRLTVYRPNGKFEEVEDPVRQAFAAFGRGDATSGQQKCVLTYILDLCCTFSVNPIAMPPEARAYTDGARTAGIAICKLVGGKSPFTLKRLGDVDSEPIDASGDD